MVTCPVCLGSKESTVTGDVCKCCDGVGEITNEAALTKSRIRADLSKLLERFANLNFPKEP